MRRFARYARYGRWLVGVSILTASPLAADEPKSENVAVLVPKARLLQHDGDLQGAEKLALDDLQNHTSVGQLAGGLEVLTSIYKQSGRYDDAMAMATRYQKVLESIPEPDASKRQDVHILMADILASTGKYADAIEHVDAALAIKNGWRGTDSLWEARTHSLRAKINQAAGHKPDATGDWQATESRAKAVLDKIDPAGANVEQEEAALKLATDAMIATDRTAEAVTMRRRFLIRQLDDEVRSENWSEIAKCYALLDQQALEEHSIREALHLEASHEGPRSKVEEADLLDRLGRVQKRQGKPAAAQKDWEEAVAIYTQLGESHSRRRQDRDRRIACLAKLAVVYEELGRWHDAVTTTETLLEARSHGLLADDPKLWRLKGSLAGLYAKAGDKEKADHSLDEIAKYWRHRSPSDATDLVPNLIALSKVAAETRDLRQTQAMAEEALTAAKRAGKGHELLAAQAEDNLGDLLTSQKHVKDAIRHYRQAVQICLTLPSDRHVDAVLCGSLLDLAKIYKAHHQYGRAADFCLMALDVRKKAPDQDPQALVGLYTATATLQLAEAREKKPGGGSDPLTQAEANIAAARRLCAEHGWSDQTAGINVLELEAVLEVRRDHLDAARKTLGRALTLSRRSHLDKLEAKIETQIAQLDRGEKPDTVKQ